MNNYKLENEIKIEFNRITADTQNITDIIPITNTFISFKADGVKFTARLTYTGKLKKHTIRVND